MVTCIRSYVRREGRITKSQQRALQDLWSKYGLELSANHISFPSVFGRSAPTVLDIGFGMGGSLLDIARNNPDNNYIGVEVFRPGIGSLMLGLEREKINNVRIFCVDAVEVLQHSIADGSLSRVLIFFPDPWPKRRHHKRRLIQSEFIELVATKLIAGGVLHLATDWQDYANYMLQVISNSKSFVNSVYEYRPITKFEQRGKRLGYDVCDLLFRKI